ncbi:MAG: hypothetical protein JNK67_29270 [Alphaproteobacteria bacterium]|nr:hypothetical protein [Alphaproteobacteria bacterium]
MAEREIIFEMRRVGSVTKASAIDVETGVEVSIMGPATAPELALREAARRKLAYVLKRRQKAAERERIKGGRGTLV